MISSQRRWNYDESFPPFASLRLFAKFEPLAQGDVSKKTTKRDFGDSFQVTDATDRQAGQRRLKEASAAKPPHLRQFKAIAPTRCSLRHIAQLSLYLNTYLACCWAHFRPRAVGRASRQAREQSWQQSGAYNIRFGCAAASAGQCPRRRIPMEPSELLISRPVGGRFVAELEADKAAYERGEEGPCCGD